jgi:hypothetical protein
MQNSDWKSKLRPKVIDFILKIMPGMFFCMSSSLFASQLPNLCHEDRSFKFRRSIGGLIPSWHKDSSIDESSFIKERLPY